MYAFIIFNLKFILRPVLIMRKNQLTLNKFHQLKQKRKRKTTPKKRIRDLERLLEKMKETNSAIDPLKEKELEQLKLNHIKK